jgi:plasmid maintenance system antidote protein VapI
LNDGPRPFLPDWTLSPGAILSEELKARGITADSVAFSTGIDAIGVLDATVPVDETIAGKLYAMLGISAQFWLNAERIYREALARGAKDCSEEYLNGADD